MAVAIPFIMIAGAAFSAISAIEGARKEKQAAEHNAALATRNAGIARDQASTDAAAQQRHSYRVIGAARAGYGASGVTLEGSPLDVLESSAMEAELDRQNILYRGELKAMGYDETSGLDQRRADSAMSAGYQQAGSAILMGASKYYSGRPASTSGYSLYEYGAERDDGLD